MQQIARSAAPGSGRNRYPSSTTRRHAHGESGEVGIGGVGAAKAASENEITEDRPVPGAGCDGRRGRRRAQDIHEREHGLGGRTGLKDARVGTDAHHRRQGAARSMPSPGESISSRSSSSRQTWWCGERSTMALRRTPTSQRIIRSPTAGWCHRGPRPVPARDLSARAEARDSRRLASADRSDSSARSLRSGGSATTGARRQASWLL